LPPAPGAAAHGAETIALSWLTPMGLAEGGVLLLLLLPEGFFRSSSVVAWGRASVISPALSLLEKLGNLPLCRLPQPHPQE
jgi:hypothetical protein